jgi:fatty-acyl-CoA synthase
MAAGSTRDLHTQPVSPWLPGGEPGSPIARGNIRGRADARAIEEVPFDRLLSGSTIFECIKAAADIHPDKTAIIQLLSADPEATPRRLAYKELVKRIVQAANLFRKLSPTERPSIVVIAPFVPEALIATWGGATAGGVTPVNPALDSQQIDFDNECSAGQYPDHDCRPLWGGRMDEIARNNAPRFNSPSHIDH